MELKEKKSFLYLLKNGQHPRTLSVGGFTDLNMVTCLNVSDFYSFIIYELQVFFCLLFFKIMKTMYSILMLLYSFLQK